MSVTAIAIMAFVISLITLFGVLIKHFKCYWLISGYNTASEEFFLHSNYTGWRDAILWQIKGS